MQRRTFLTNSALGLGTLAAMYGGGSKLEGSGPGREQSESEDGAPDRWTEPVGRPVRVSSVAYADTNMPLRQIADYVSDEASHGTDIIALPELCRGQDGATEEDLDGPTITAMASVAKKYKTYIACPIDRRDGSRRLNSVVLLDRSGRVVSIYNKVFPYWSELDVRPPEDPGEDVEVYQADFGRVGFATCYDVNFPEVWRRLDDKLAELVIWPSAYSGGTSLQAHAIAHHYYIVTCTKQPDCQAFDITGERLLHSSAETVNLSRITLDLDRAIFHQNFNLEKRDQLLKEHPLDVIQERWMPLEQWFVLRAKRPGVSARSLASEYGLEELRHYLRWSRIAMDKRRGWEFAEKLVFPEKQTAALKALAEQTEVWSGKEHEILAYSDAHLARG